MNAGLRHGLMHEWPYRFLKSWRRGEQNMAISLMRNGPRSRSFPSLLFPCVAAKRKEVGMGSEWALLPFPPFFGLPPAFRRKRNEKTPTLEKGEIDATGCYGLLWTERGPLCTQRIQLPNPRAASPIYSPLAAPPRSRRAPGKATTSPLFLQRRMRMAIRALFPIVVVITALLLLLLPTPSF